MPVANTIPASNYAQINPSVLSAGANAPSMSGLYLDSGNRVPVGTVQSFGSPSAVANYFGASSIQYTDSLTYFVGFTNKTQTPGALLFAQYPTSAVSAWLRGGSLAAMTLAQLQALSGTITMVIDGQSWTSSSINLSSATSFSNAASLIQTALAANDASFTAAIAPASATLTGVLASGVLTASAVTGPIVPGAALAGAGVTSGTTITSQLSGTAGGAGTYQTSGTQTLSSESMTAANANASVMTVSAVASGNLAVGQVVAGASVTTGTQITGELGANGAAGEYVVTPSQTVSSEATTSGAAVVSFDSVSSAFVIAGGTPGTAGTIAFPTTDSLTTSLALTASAGAVTSQGAAAVSSSGASGTITPAAYMASLIQITQNFASFATNFEPTIADKKALSAWNSGQNNQFGYVMDSTEIALTQTNAGGTALANIIAAGYSGTIPNYQPAYLHTAAFVMGMVASVNYNAPNGRISLAYKASSALTPGVTNLTAAQNLEANGCNYYGITGNPANNWNVYFPGSVTGPYAWADSYFNQIWLNQSLQSAIMGMLTSVNSVPYNQIGYDLVSAACNAPIQQALTNGVITPGVVLSATQISDVNQAAGANIASILATRGWCLQVGPATPAQRVVRSSPPCTLWYCDGGNINRINLASILVQ